MISVNSYAFGCSAVNFVVEGYAIFTGNRSENGNIRSVASNCEFSGFFCGVGNYSAVFVLVVFVNSIEVLSDVLCPTDKFIFIFIVLSLCGFSLMKNNIVSESVV